MQNKAARLVMNKRRRDHATPLLKELHWLPVKFRCQYKITTLAYLHFEGSLPPYLSSSLCTYEPSRSLRSSNEKLLKIRKRKIKSFGQRSFSFMAPSLWNSNSKTLYFMTASPCYTTNTNKHDNTTNKYYKHD